MILKFDLRFYNVKINRFIVVLFIVLFELAWMGLKFNIEGYGRRVGVSI